jgi:hypothetical protein
MSQVDIEAGFYILYLKNHYYEMGIFGNQEMISYFKLLCQAARSPKLLLSVSVQ